MNTVGNAPDLIQVVFSGGRRALDFITVLRIQGEKLMLYKKNKHKRHLMLDLSSDISFWICFAKSRK